MLTSSVALLHDNTVHGEDNYLLRPLSDNAFVDAVMDGVTGRKGKEASQAVVDALAAAPLTSPDDVVAVLAEVNAHLYRPWRGHSLLTTATVALVMDRTLYVIGVGDSLALLIRSAACHLLSGHTRGLMRAGMTKALGERQPLGKLARAEVTLEPGDRVVLATDGVTGNITRDALLDIVRQAATPEAAVAHINAMLVNRYASGHVPEPLSGPYQQDDRTAICRFFST